MPSFDIVSEVDKQEIDNAINQARKELATRFDFKGTTAEVIHEKDKIILTAEDAARAGFDDRFIYEQLEVEYRNRTIPAVQLMREEAREAFREWAKSPHRIDY